MFAIHSRPSSVGANEKCLVLKRLLVDSRENVGPGNTGNEMNFILFQKLAQNLTADSGFVLSITDYNLCGQPSQLATK